MVGRADGRPRTGRRPRGPQLAARTAVRGRSLLHPDLLPNRQRAVGTRLRDAARSGDRVRATAARRRRRTRRSWAADVQAGPRRLTYQGTTTEDTGTN